MILNWLLFLVLSVLTYICISIFGQITGGQNSSIWRAGLAALKPVPLIIGTVANVFFGMAIYTGFKISKFSIPASISLGVIVAEIYAVAVLGGIMTVPKYIGTGLILIGVFLLS